MTDRLSPQREAEIRERLAKAKARRMTARAIQPLNQHQVDAAALLAELAAVRAERDEAQAESVRLAGLLGERDAELEPLRGRASAAGEYYRKLQAARAELAKYVGKEPTVLEEMTYLKRCLNAVHDLCDGAEKQAKRREDPLPVPEWVDRVRAAAEGATS